MSKIKGKYIDYDTDTLDVSGDTLQVKDDVFAELDGSGNIQDNLADGVTATTQALGDNTTKVATTAFAVAEAEAREHYDIFIDASGNGDYTDISTATSTEPAYTTFFIRGGTYTLTSNIVMKGGQQLIGESRETVIIDQNETTYCIEGAPGIVLKRFSLINGRNTSQQIYLTYDNQCVLEELYLDSGVTGGLGNYISGLMLYNCHDCYLNNIFIKGYLYNFKIENSDRTRCSNLISQYAQLYGLRLRDSNFTTMTNFVSYEDSSAIYCRDSSYAVITNMVAENCTYGFYFYSTSVNTHNTITNFQGTCYTSFAFFGSDNNSYNTFIGVDLNVATTIKGNYNKMIGCSIGNLTVYTGATGTTITGSKFGTLTDNGTDTAVIGCDYTSSLNLLNQNTPVTIGGTVLDDRLYVIGSGTTSATNTILCKNASAINTFQVRDDGSTLAYSKLMVGGDTSATQPFSLINNSDVFTIDHDGTNTIFTTSDGGFKFTNVEHATDTDLIVRAQASQDARINLMLDTTNTLLFDLETGSSVVKCLENAPKTFSLYEASTSGTTKDFRIYGYRTGDALRYLSMSISTSVNDTALFDGVGSYVFDGDITGDTGSFTSIKVTSGAFTGGLNVNTSGSSTGDFNVSTDTVANAFFIDASDDVVNINVSTKGTSASFSGGVSINGSGSSTGDFNVSTDTVNNALFIDASADRGYFNIPVIFDNTQLTTEVAGALEYYDDRFYITNVGTQRAIDRTSDVIVSTTTVTNTVTETTLYTGTIGTNNLKVGNVLKLHCDGLMSTASAADDVTIKVYMGTNEILSFNPAVGNITNAHWHMDGNMTVRTIGTTGTMAYHLDLDLDGNATEEIGTDTFNTTTDLSFKVTVTWDNADAGNIYAILQGYTEWKN